jgi:hypothetical protein
VRERPKYQKGELAAVGDDKGLQTPKDEPEANASQCEMSCDAE